MVDQGSIDRYFSTTDYLGAESTYVFFIENTLYNALFINFKSLTLLTAFQNNLKTSSEHKIITGNRCLSRNISLDVEKC